MGKESTLTLYGIGVGPGDPQMVTLEAVSLLKEADALFLPISAEGRASVAGGICAALSEMNRERSHEFFFPMTQDTDERDREIERRLRELEPVWRSAESVVFPVIGDSSLYATVAYLYSVWKKLCPSLRLQLVPGISAHSLAASVAGEFMALGEECFAILPGSAAPEKLAASLSTADSAALYKPSALGEALPELVRRSGPWARMLRVHRAGLAEQRLIWGEEAIAPTDDYLSVLLLWRHR